MERIIDPPPPAGWSGDALTQYLDTCRSNQWATFSNKRSEVVDLVTIDQMFRKLLDGAVNPRPLLPMGFLQRAHSAYLTACGAVMAGQLHEAQALLRVCLEQGGYANYVGIDQPRWERWMGRHDPRTRSQQDKWKEEFTHRKVVRSIASADLDLGRSYSELYDRTIDYGAHPNERGSSMSSAFEDVEDGGKRFVTIYLSNNELYLAFALKTSAQVGLCVLRIAQMIYPLRLQATGVHLQLATLCKRF